MRVGVPKEIKVHEYRVGLTPSSVRENLVGATIGQLSANDQDSGQTHSFTTSDSRLEIVGTTLRFKSDQYADFGAGATSYDYVRKLPVDAVKIDGDLVGGLGDPMTQGLIRGFVDLCRSMKLETIAEMIETDQVADQLKALGVEYGQGWLFGRAEAEPRTQLASAAPIRRRGAVEAWG